MGLVSCPITPIVVLFELGYGCSTMCFMFDLQFNHRVIIGYFVFALFNGAFMTYFMIIRPQQQGYQDKDHENYRKLDPRFKVYTDWLYKHLCCRKSKAQRFDSFNNVVIEDEDEPDEI